jgi:hypothetical protein
MSMEYKVGIVGPTRVGKTSLITAVLEDAQRLLQGKPVSLQPAHSQTKQRFDRHQNELHGTLSAAQKQFSAGNLRGTEEPFIYQLELTPGDCDFRISLNIMDYPGGWIDEDRRPANRQEDWRGCQQWFKDSPVLIIPIDASVAMEASEGTHRAAAPFILTIAQVAGIAREWGKERKKRSHEPAAVLICPVKCESYFADNGGTKNEAPKLLSTIRSLYEPVIHAVKGEAPHVNIIYSPIDTIGCIELIEARWQPDPAVPGGMDFSADYLVRKPYRRQVKGADAVLITLMKQFVAMEQDVKNAEAKGKTEIATRDFGFFGNMWHWLNGQRGLDRVQAQLAWRRVEDLKEALSWLGSQPYGSRVENL